MLPSISLLVFEVMCLVIALCVHFFQDCTTSDQCFRPHPRSKSRLSSVLCANLNAEYIIPLSCHHSRSCTVTFIFLIVASRVQLSKFVSNLIHASIHILIHDRACFDHLRALCEFQCADCLDIAPVGQRDVGNDGSLRVAPQRVLQKQLRFENKK